MLLLQTPIAFVVSSLVLRVSFNFFYCVLFKSTSVFIMTNSFGFFLCSGHVLLMPDPLFSLENPVCSFLSRFVALFSLL